MIQNDTTRLSLKIEAPFTFQKRSFVCFRFTKIRVSNNIAMFKKDHASLCNHNLTDPQASQTFIRYCNSVVRGIAYYCRLKIS